jgi:hypothetical protein
MLNGVLYTKIRYGDVCQAAGNIKEFALGKITPGQWHTGEWIHIGNL